MSKKLTSRERWFMTALPAMLVLAVYVFGVHRSQQASLADAQRALLEARSENVTQNQVILKRQAAKSLQSKLNATRREHSANPSKSHASQGLSVSDETRAMAKITDIFKQQNILVAASTRLSDSDVRNVMPAGLAEATKNIPGTKGLGSSVWRMEMVGSFGDLRTSLAAIDALDVLVVPLCVSMEPSPDGGAIHHWSFWVWL